MIFYWLLFIAGIIIFYTLYKDIEDFLNVNIVKNIFFPLFLIVVLFFGLYITQTIHSSEIIARNSTPQMQVGLYWCWVEDQGECNSIVQGINNNSSGIYFIGVSFVSLLFRNMFSYFIGGLFVSWFVNRLILAVKINGR